MLLLLMPAFAKAMADGVFLFHPLWVCFFSNVYRAIAEASSAKINVNCFWLRSAGALLNLPEGDFPPSPRRPDELGVGLFRDGENSFMPRPP